MLRALRRQWVLTLVGVLATVALCVAVVQWFPPSYRVTATVLLLPPTETENPEQANPLLMLGGLMAPADVLISALGDPAIVSEVKADGLDGEYDVTRDFGTSAPVLLIHVEDTDLDQVRRTRDQLLTLVSETLRQLQDSVNVAAKDQITSTVISPEGEVTTTSRPTQRALVVAMLGGLGLTVGLATLADSLRASRPRRQGRHQGDAGIVEEPAAVTPTSKDAARSDEQAWADSLP